MTSFKLYPVKHHIFLCSDQTNPKCCDKEQGLIAWEFLKNRLKELNLNEELGIFRTKANCLRVCKQGPVAVVYPDGIWYRRCEEKYVEELYEKHLINNQLVSEIVDQIMQ